MKIPGAVNSPVRAWTAVADTLLFIAKGTSAYVLDCGGNRLVDYCPAFTPLVKAKQAAQAQQQTQ